MKTESSSRRCSGNYGKFVKTEESTDTKINALSAVKFLDFIFFKIMQVFFIKSLTILP